jgi:hypothetical protein
LQKAYSNLIESRPLPLLTGPALQHAKRNTVGDKSKSSIPRSIAFQSDRIAYERT